MIRQLLIATLVLALPMLMLGRAEGGTSTRTVSSSETSYYNRQVMRDGKHGSEGAVSGQFRLSHQRNNEAPIEWSDGFQDGVRRGDVELLDEHERDLDELDDDFDELDHAHHFGGELHDEPEEEAQTYAQQQQVAPQLPVKRHLDAQIETTKRDRAELEAPAPKEPERAQKVEQRQRSEQPQRPEPAKELHELYDSERFEMRPKYRKASAPSSPAAHADEAHFDTERFELKPANRKLNVQASAQAYAAIEPEYPSYSGPTSGDQSVYSDERDYAQIRPWISSKLDRLAPAGHKLKRLSSKLKNKSVEAINRLYGSSETGQRASVSASASASASAGAYY